uniref:Large ribosomal subunit protein uL13c n=1 Tax=Acrosorium ciliolatum TaxID=1550622 RepID=A0A1Z1M1V1_9FLOR|nr:ribosomal protein L13 [Acrosorium ciliolatum]ARW60058.1 ribosomal protein L13 [Acrosorium ciliolatum]
MLINKNITYIEKKKNITKWYIIDAKNQNLGRLSTQIAYLLIGKNYNTYTPYLKNSINIIVINSKFINITGKKKEQKTYKKHSGKPGGLKIENFQQLNQRIPNRIIEKAIKGMLPKNTLGRNLFKQLKVYPNTIHPHSAQQPTLLKLH